MAPKDALAPYQQNWERTQTTINGKNTQEAKKLNTFRSNAWDTDIEVTGINWNDKEATLELYNVKKRLARDCDLDC